MDTLTARLSARRSLPPASMRRAIRKAAGASLQDVANAFEPPISRFTVRAWEDGTRNPGPENVEQYAAILRALQGL
jgi:DNA-binding transcriptional regulator YiaG